VIDEVKTLGHRLDETPALATTVLRAGRGLVMTFRRHSPLIGTLFREPARASSGALRESRLEVTVRDEPKTSGNASRHRRPRTGVLPLPQQWRTAPNRLLSNLTDTLTRAGHPGVSLGADGPTWYLTVFRQRHGRLLFNTKEHTFNEEKIHTKRKGPTTHRETLPQLPYMIEERR